MFSPVCVYNRCRSVILSGVPSHFPWSGTPQCYCKIVSGGHPVQASCFSQHRLILTKPRGEPVFPNVHYGTSGMKTALARLNKTKLNEHPFYRTSIITSSYGAVEELIASFLLDTVMSRCTGLVCWPKEILYFHVSYHQHFQINFILLRREVELEVGFLLDTAGPRDVIRS